MAIDLRNLKENVISNKEGEKIISNVTGIKKSEANEPTKVQSEVVEFYNPNSIKRGTLSDKKNLNKQKSDIISEPDITNKVSPAQWILLIYTTIFLAVLSCIVFINWSNIWQLPKTMIFIFGVSGFLILASILWIFGGIKHIVRISLGDIMFVFLGLSILIISFINPNQIAFWGSTTRIFDAGIFIGYLTLFYILLKVFFEKKTFDILVLLFAFISLIGLLVGAISIYIPNFTSLLPMLTKLQITGTWLTESPQELVFISLLVFNIIFIFLFQNKSKNVLNTFLLFLYYFAVFIHIILLIRLPDYSMYTLTVLALLINTIFYINKLLKDNVAQTSNRLIVSRVSFIYGFIGIVLIAMAIIRPFQNNSQFPEYTTLTVPNIDTTLSITKQSIQSDTWLGSGNIMYAWNKFTPSVVETQISDFSFETLYNEIANIVVRNGLIITLIMGIWGIWILGGILRLFLIHKTIPIETYTLIIAIIGLFVIPFTIVTKALFVLILVLWSNIISKYFNPIIKLNLDINKIPASISSFLTFVILFSIATTIFASTKFYNILKSQEYVVKAFQIQDNLTERVDLLAKAQTQSPYIIEYAHLYIPAIIQQINEQAVELSNSSQKSDTGNVDAEKQSNLQDKIIATQSLIDEYKDRFPSDTRVIYWKLDLYSTIHRYGVVDENEYLSLISQGRELQRNSLYWDIYEAQYYARQAQKEQKVNVEQLDKAKTILKSVIEKNLYFVQAYQNYYDVLSLNQEYTEQINVLNKYVDVVVSNNLIANQDLVYLLGVAYQNNKQYDDALLVYNKLIETLPEYTNVYFKLGELYEVQKKTDLAIQNYNKVLELDPNAEAARLKLEQLQ